MKQMAVERWGKNLSDKKDWVLEREEAWRLLSQYVLIEHA